jgi:hypothetical protein
VKASLGILASNFCPVKYESEKALLGPVHSGIQGKEVTDALVWKKPSDPFLGPEPAVPGVWKFTITE